MAFVRREVKKDSAYLFAGVFAALSILLILYTVVFSSTDTLTPALVLPLASRYLASSSLSEKTK